MRDIYIIKTIYSQICISSYLQPRQWWNIQNKSACRYNASIQPGSNRDRIAHGSISRRRIRQDVKAQSQADDGKLPPFSEFPFCRRRTATSFVGLYGCRIQEYQSQRFYRGGLPLCPGSFALISICYGLLRPLDLIKPYRMEYDVKLPELGEGNMYIYWRARQTEPLIEEVKADDNLLINLGSMDLQPSFDWKR
mgnify:CR=1 FL=1